MIEIAEKIAANNKTSPYLKALRIKDSVVMATDLVNTVQCFGNPISGVDCFVEAETFMSAYDALKAPTFTQTEGMLEVKSGKSRVSMQLQEKSQFPFKDDYKPEGVPIPAGNFASAVNRLSDFSGFARTLFYITDDYLYATDKNFVVRTPLTTKFPQTVKEDGSVTAFALSMDFINVFKQIKNPITEILVSDTKVTVIYDMGWLEGTRPAIDFSVNFDKHFLPEYFTEGVKVEGEVQDSLKLLCKNAGKNNQAGFNDRATFSALGVVLKKQNKNHWNIDLPNVFKEMSFDAVFLKTVMNVSTELFFTPPHLRFKGEELEGIWAGVSDE